MLTGLTQHDSRPALTFGGRTLSFGELREAAAAVAPSLAGASRIAVWAEPSLEFCVAAVAAVVAGLPLVPINPKLGSAELEHVFADNRPDILIGAPQEVMQHLALTRLDVDLAARRPPSGQEAIDDEAPALIVYTSGTTGRPKGAVLSRRAIATNLDALAEAWSWDGNDVLVHGLPLFHVHGLVLGLFGPLRRGSALHHLGRFTAADAAAAMRKGATMMFGVPTMYHRIALESQGEACIAEGLRGARLLVSGSAALPAPVFEQIHALTGQEVVERYGMTETLMNLAVRADGERRPGQVGIPVPGVDVRLIDDEGRGGGGLRWLVTMGEIVVRGPNLFSGYLNRPEATADALRDGWFHTGDFATRRAGGYWQIVGRRSTDLIKTGGYKVGAGEIEVALCGSSDGDRGGGDG